ncbi:T9SS type B sorting domain-containing protein [Tamlana sp. 2_MG-2023]|uniref:T9SS type B sorting domain-containing protein n=1 Tax=unclassified Tamlana TaxID=2614803 RepID=UPI0026E2E3C5|nr:MULTISPECIES: T9SS type B sorting domain-containing protein [unclassified Tamlana]MDO6759059.1 T9SS type B sorting domain-containing protein [Tamlana sp. 2_MG-2023]MDO6789758.1 T9SS type B sorting domain-containing protein [Tamlana sp. 1_MG-2023]
MKRHLLLLIFLISINVFAQNQAANWYFGNKSGVRFDSNTNTVSAVQDGKLSTIEGCTSISDDSGNLLFYTDGITIWNKNHEIMSNGYGLYGDPSSTQSAIIVPKPKNDKIYYVFTVDDYGIDYGVRYGCNYSIVDLSLNSGLGEVTTKNVNLLRDSAEKITAVLKDCVSKSFWVLTYASQDGNLEVFDTFHAFEVTNLGVNSKSIKSTFSKKTLDRRGYLKLSPDGLKVACANSYDGLDIYDFDVATGKVSNQNTLISAGSSSPYGVEFSPDSKLLYTQTSNILLNDANINDPSIHYSKLIQYNLYATQIQASAIILDDRQMYRGALQLGPNGKIYRALSTAYYQGIPYLGAINEPNKIGLNCDYEHHAISLSPSSSTQGLPPFIASFFNKQIDIIKNGEQSTTLNLCESDQYTLVADLLPGATYSWSKNSVLLTESSNQLLVHEPGHYEVIIDPNNGDCLNEGEAYVSYNQNPTALNHTIFQCEEDVVLDGKTIFNLNQAFLNLTGNETDRTVEFYSDPSRTKKINGDAFANTVNPQTIYTKIIDNKTSCFSVSELNLEVSTTDINDITLKTCDDDGLEDGFYNFNLTEANQDILNGISVNLDINYYETYEDALVEQNPLADFYTNTSAFSQAIFARAESGNNCYGISNVQLLVRKAIEVTLDNETYYCLNNYPASVSIHAGVINDSANNYTYNWNTGATTESIQVNTIGDYTVTITDTYGCFKIKTITLVPSNIATITSIDVKDASENNSITVSVSGEGNYQYQLIDSNNQIVFDFQESSTFEDVSPGHYSVSVKDVKNNCGITSENVSVIGFPKFFTPNHDGINDTWQVYGLYGAHKSDTKILIFDRYGKLLKELHPEEEGWDGTFRGEKLSSGDYWFSIKLADGRIYKNHFTLKN